MYAYIYDNFLDDYDFFHFSGREHELHLIKLNSGMRSLISMYLLVIGCKWESNFTWANSGYTISKKALKAFVEGPLQTCETGKEGSAEDLVLMGICLNTFISKLIYTADSSGAHHYHQSPVWGMFKQQGTSVTSKNAWFLSEDSD